MKKLIAFLGCLCCSISLPIHAQFKSADFKRLHRLVGSWKMNTAKGFLMELWEMQDDSTLLNKSYRVMASDTIPQETVVLSLRKDIIVFSSTVANQNNQQPVPFSLVKIEDGKYIFENKLHDFPQQIFYRIADNNILEAGISGMIKDKYQEKLFNFYKQH
ncbi:MAG: hypothetical protein H7X88_11780 [Gloeobacteraceae cyanobacterium ES-bin-316]|nr:hypothetical protein [Ferruginibacter sp.]